MKTGWDLSISGSQSTGTIRNSRPPQSPIIAVNQRKTSESGQQVSAYRSRLTESSETTSGKDNRASHNDEHKGHHLDDVIDSLIM